APRRDRDTPDRSGTPARAPLRSPRSTRSRARKSSRWGVWGGAAALPPPPRDVAHTRRDAQSHKTTWGGAAALPPPSRAAPRVLRDAQYTPEIPSKAYAFHAPVPSCP